MNWGLTQGILGRANKSLMPSVTAIGPNSYLAPTDFFKMLGLAVLVHVLAFVISALLPDNSVNHIPVRALSFKLGGADQVAAYAPAPQPVAAPKPVAAPVMQATTNESWRPSAVVPKPVTPPPLKPIAKPVPVPAPAPKPVPAAAKQPKVYKVEEPPKPVETPQPTPSPQAPKQYVREVGAAPALPTVQPAAAAAASPTGAVGGQGAVTSVSEQVAQAVRARYEQDISGWIQRHKFYPAAAGGREGRVVVRMRIDRMGNVRYYAIEQSSGLTALDAAALDMIRRANPVPAVPENYPAGNLVEFLIPISFKAPQ